MQSNLHPGHTVCALSKKLDPHFGEGKNRSLLPVSKSTVPFRGSVSGFESLCMKVIPVKFTSVDRYGTILKLSFAMIGQRAAANGADGSNT